MSASVRRLWRVDFTASDLERTETFYAALGFVSTGREAVDGAERALFGLPEARAERLSMRLGDQDVSFLRFDPPGRPYPEGSTATDLWFQHIAIAVSDMGQAHARVLAAGAAPITRGGPQTLPPNTGCVTAFKFRDPDGHPLELLSFPEGTGAPAWHAPGGSSPFLGIDHTALAVGDAARTQAFFEKLGLTVGAGSHNAGPGQERLDDVAGDRCRVVPLSPPQAPPHVELLGYAVGLRRPMPERTRADDIWATRVWVAVDGIAPEERARAVTLPSGAVAVLVHDPDGHAVVLVESPASA